MAAGSNGALASAVKHVERAWSCAARPFDALHFLTVNDRVVAVAAIKALSKSAETHEWLDVPMADWSALRRAGEDARCPSLVVARYDDAVVFVDQKHAGVFAALCSSGDGPRVRLMRKIMSPVTYESRW